MRKLSIIIVLILSIAISVSSCRKSSGPSPFYQLIQDLWTRDCGCSGQYFEIKGDSILLSSDGVNFFYDGFVRNDTAFVECPFCSPSGLEYFPTPITLSSDRSHLTLGTAPSGYICQDTTCTDMSYHRAN
jgi:hypothetical protein